MILLALTLSVSSETLIIFSNFAVVMSTLLLWSASLREQHQTIKTIIKGNNVLSRMIVKAFKGTPKE